MPMSMQEMSAELRYKAARIRPEMCPSRDLDSHDGKGYPVSLMLVIAFLDAVNAEWNERESAGGIEFQAMCAKARELCSHKYNDHPGADCELMIASGNEGAEPAVVKVPKTRFPGDGQTLEYRNVLALQMSFVGARPLWAYFLDEARRHIEEDAEARGVDPWDEIRQPAATASRE